MTLYEEINKHAKEISQNIDIPDASHFDDFRANIYNSSMDERFRRMFIYGNGGELKCKATATYSSSMLGYNFFHWINEETPLTLENITYTKVFFEVKLPTLKGTTAANIDIVLKGEDKHGNCVLLFIENKFTEYLSNSKSTLTKMANSTYCTKSDKYYIGEDNARKWMGIIKYFSDQANASTNNGYYDGIKQNICHLIALSNLKNSKDARLSYERKYASHTTPVEHPGINGTEIFLFKNLVFKPRKDFGLQDSFTAYNTLYNTLLKKVKEICSLDFFSPNESILSLGDVWPDIKASIKDTELIYYLEKRYISSEAFIDKQNQ
mgnify:CR=1 FL=1